MSSQTSRLAVLADQTEDDVPAHLVLESEHPTALCGAVVACSWTLSDAAPGRDRCVECLRVARVRGIPQ